MRVLRDFVVGLRLGFGTMGICGLFGLFWGKFAEFFGLLTVVGAIGYVCFGEIGRKIC